MAAGLPGRVIEPVAASSPDWVQQVVNWAAVMWTRHPVPAAAAAVWIQVGTDPNSMIPFALLAVAGYLALARVPPAAGFARYLGRTGLAVPRP